MTLERKFDELLKVGLAEIYDYLFEEFAWARGSGRRRRQKFSGPSRANRSFAFTRAKVLCGHGLLSQPGESSPQSTSEVTFGYRPATSHFTPRRWAQASIVYRLIKLKSHAGELLLRACVFCLFDWSASRELHCFLFAWRIELFGFTGAMKIERRADADMVTCWFECLLVLIIYI